MGVLFVCASMPSPSSIGLRHDKWLATRVGEARVPGPYDEDDDFENDDDFDATQVQDRRSDRYSEGEEETIPVASTVTTSFRAGNTTSAISEAINSNVRFAPADAEMRLCPQHVGTLSL